MLTRRRLFGLCAGAFVGSGVERAPVIHRDRVEIMVHASSFDDRSFQEHVEQKVLPLIVRDIEDRRWTFAVVDELRAHKSREVFDALDPDFSCCLFLFPTNQTHF